MNDNEALVRITISLLIIFYAVISGHYILLVLGLPLFYTGYKKFCFVYYIFKINEKLSTKNYYLSLLPRYKTLPVFIFDEKCKMIFQNDSSKKLLPQGISLQDIGIEDCSKMIEQNYVGIKIYKVKNKTYQVEIKGIKDEDILLLYFYDVTELVNLNKEIEETQKEIIYAMGEIGETRSKETGNHVKRVAEYSKLLAQLHGLSKTDTNHLYMASPMHDIGKVGIPDSILNAPRKLSEDEFEIMKTHAALGYEMLKHSSKPILKAAATVAHEHHEKYDGSGYPRGLKGEDIHIFGRITAIADVFDALGSERVYKKAWELDRILKLFEDEKGKHFDPKLTELFFKNLNSFLLIRDKYKDIAIV